MSESSQWTRAIVLSPESAGNGSGISTQLSAMLSQRDWYPVEQHDPYLALAELALREKAQTSRASWGLQRLERLALVIIDPAHWTQLELLIKAVQKYITLASVWVVQDDELVQIESEPDDRPVNVNGVTAATAPIPQPAPSPLSSEPVQHKDVDRSERISRQEIDMLLEMPDESGAEERSGGARR